MTRIRVALLVVAAGCALAVSAVAYAAFAGGGPSPDPFVVGGGGFESQTSLGLFVRDFGLDAHVEKKGTKVYGILRYGRNTNANASVVQFNVSCARIVGGEAVVGGTIAADPLQGWVMFLNDTGTPGGAPDQVTLAFAEPLGAAVWPAGFPATCPSPSDRAAYGLAYNDLERGDVIVSGGSS